MSPRPAAFALAVLVLLGGCAGGGVPPSDGDQSPTTSPDEASPSAAATETVAASPNGTTAPTEAPEDGAATTATGTNAEMRTTAEMMTTERSNETLPPGLNESGVEDADALVAAHRAALNETGFAFRFRANVSVEPAVQWTLMRGRVEPGFAPLVVHSTSLREFEGDATQVGTDLWANDTAVAVRYRGEDDTELRLSNRTGDGVGAYDETWDHLPRADLESQVTQSWLVELALAVGDYRLARTEPRDGRSVTVLRATEPVAAANYTDLNATLVVDETGLVHEVSLTATAEGDDETRIRYEFELTEVGSVAVDRPDWVAEAEPPNATVDNETTTGTTAVTGDDGGNATTVVDG